MGLFNRLIAETKNVFTRDVTIQNFSKNLYMIVITEYGKTRYGLLDYDLIVQLQFLLRNKNAVKRGIAVNIPIEPNGLRQRFEIPSWAMEQLRDDLLNNRITLQF